MGCLISGWLGDALAGSVLGGELGFESSMSRSRLKTSDGGEEEAV